MNSICNIPRNDGFGAQLQTIIWTYIYCKMKNQKFFYSPIEDIAHNYDNDPNFINSIEDLINLKDNIDLASNELKEIVKKIEGKLVRQIYKYIEKNINSKDYMNYLNDFKKIFFLNKQKNNNENIINVAIHIRRPNPHDNRILGTNTPDKYYLKIIKHIKNKYAEKNLKIHIYSQGDISNFQIYQDDNVLLHINEDMIDTFMGMVNSDILVTSASSFSYIAAFLNEGEIYYKKFWHPPMEKWIVSDYI